MAQRSINTRERDPAELAGCLQMAEILARRYGAARGPAWQDRTEDLVQEALLVVHRAWETFDPQRGLRFSTYAYPCITKRLRRIAGQLESRLRTISLDAAMGADGETRLDELVPDERVDVAREAIQRAGGQLAPYLAQLKPRARHILRRRYYEGWTLAQVGAELRVTREAIRLAEKKALLHLRSKLTQELQRAQAA